MSFLAIGMKLLGFGKSIWSFIGKLYERLTNFIIHRPWQAAVIALAIALFAVAHNDARTHQLLETARSEIKSLKNDIHGVTIQLDAATTVLKKEKAAHRSDIEKHNKEIDGLKKASDQMVATAEKRLADSRKQLDRIHKLQVDYSVANDANVSCDKRIENEEHTNERFFDDWKEVSK